MKNKERRLILSDEISGLLKGLEHQCLTMNDVIQNYLFWSGTIPSRTIPDDLELMQVRIDSIKFKLGQLQEVVKAEQEEWEEKKIKENYAEDEDPAK